MDTEWARVVEMRDVMLLIIGKHLLRYFLSQISGGRRRRDVCPCGAFDGELGQKNRGSSNDQPRVEMGRMNHRGGRPDVLLDEIDKNGKLAVFLRGTETDEDIPTTAHSPKGERRHSVAE